MSALKFDKPVYDELEKSETEENGYEDGIRKKSIHGTEALTGDRNRRRSYAEINRIGSVSGPVIPADELEGSVINSLLILTCVAFRASSFLFSFDNAIISPVVALPTFISSPVLHSSFFDN